MQFNTSFHSTTGNSADTFHREITANYSTNQIYHQTANNFYNTSVDSKVSLNEEHDSLGQLSTYQWIEKYPSIQDDIKTESFAVSNNGNKGDSLNYFHSVLSGSSSNEIFGSNMTLYNRNQELSVFSHGGDDDKFKSNTINTKGHIISQDQKNLEIKSGERNGNELCTNDEEHNHASDNHSFEKQLLDTAQKYSKYPLDRVAVIIKKLDKEIEEAARSVNSKELKHLQLERKKQQHLFALVLLFQTFKISPDSVCPRNIVYLKYAEACKENRIQPICNAAFGKIVKVFNPNIKTRRLGMRGCSKYNYCGIELLTQESVLSQTGVSAKYSSTLELERDKEGNTILGKNTSNDLSEFYLSLTSDKSKPLWIQKSLDSFENRHAEILRSFFDYGMQIINDLKLWDLESFLYRLRCFDSQGLLSKDLFGLFELEFGDDELLMKITEIFVYLGMNALEIVHNTVLFKPSPLMKENLKFLTEDFNKYLESVNVNNRILRNQHIIGQKFINTVARIEKTFLTFDFFVQCFKNELDVNVFVESYASLDFQNIISEAGFEEQVKNKYYSFLKDIKVCITCISFESYGKKAVELSSLGKASVYLTKRIERLVNDLNYISLADIIFQMNTVGMMLLQEALIKFPPEQHQKWLYFIGWVNSYFILIGQLGNFKIKRRT